MKIETFENPHSSFLSVEKDLNLIISKIMKNQRLLKLLYYPTSNCMTQPDLTNEQKMLMFGEHIRIVPKIEVDPEIKSYLTISLNNFFPNDTNPEFRDNSIYFDIVCDLDCWHIQDFELRPYRIAAEIDSMFNGKHLTGIGDLEFVGAKLDVITDQLVGMALAYKAIHGGEDKRGMPNPAKEADFIRDFNHTFNEE